MRFMKWLQFFAEDGATENPGEIASPVAGENIESEPVSSLENLGVPKDKIDRFNRAKARKGVAAPAAEPEPLAQPAVAQEEPVQPETAPSRMTWEEIMADPEYNKEVQNIVSKRLKKSNSTIEKFSKLAPSLELLGQRYGIDATDIDKLDVDALNEAINADHVYYEDKAAEMGTDTETAMRIDRMEREQARRDREDAKAERQRQQEQFFMNLNSQAEAMKKVYPNFDLAKEMQNERFVRMVSPGGGCSVEDAFFAIHRQELQQAQAESLTRQVTERLSNAVRSGSMRPQENGGVAAASSPNFAYSNMSKEERDALKSRIRAAAARGEHLNIGG